MVTQRRQILQFTTDDTIDPEKLAQLGKRLLIQSTNINVSLIYILNKFQIPKVKMKI